MSYHHFKTPEGEDGPIGSFEVFWHDKQADEDGEDMPSGWYWWACFPGCLPDGEPIGPFTTEAEAVADAQEDT